MKTKNLLKDILGKWNFPVLKETDTSLVFRYQMNFIQANLNNDDDMDTVSLTLAGVFTAENDEEMFLCLRACNELNFSIFHVKLYIDADADLVIASEFFYNDEKNLENLFKSGLDVMLVSKKKFLEKYRELEDEAKLISELEKE